MTVTNAPITDVTPILTMPNLTVAEFGGDEVTDISAFTARYEGMEPGITPDVANQVITLPDATAGVPFTIPTNIVDYYGGAAARINPDNLGADAASPPYQVTGGPYWPGGTASSPYAVSWATAGTGHLYWEDPRLDQCGGCRESTFSGSFVQAVH